MDELCIALRSLDSGMWCVNRLGDQHSAENLEFAILWLKLAHNFHPEPQP